MVNPRYVPEHKRIAREFKQLRRSLGDIQRPTGTEKNRSLLKLEQAIEALETQQATLETQQAALAAAQRDLGVTVAELASRRSHEVAPALLPITATTPGQYPTASRALNFPPPEGGGRVATLLLSGEFVRTSATGNLTIWVEILQAGSSTWKRGAAFVVGDTLSAPPAWGNPSISDFIQLNVRNEAAAGMAVRLHAHTFVAQTVRAEMRNITATLTYGGRI